MKQEFIDRVINSYGSSLVGFGLLLFAFGFYALGDKVTSGLCAAAGLGLIAKKDGGSKPTSIG